MLLAAALVVMVLPLGHAQDAAQQQAAALAPAQTMVDAVPGIVATAVDEARRDGTPDAAQTRADELLAFVVGLDDIDPLPTDSAGARHGLEAAMTWAVDVARLTAGIPADVGGMQRDLAACASEPDASRDRVGQWMQGLAANRRLSAYQAALAAAADSAPPGIEIDPLSQAVEHLDALAQADGSVLVVCVEEAAVRVNLTLEVPETLRLVPDRTWPTGQVLVVGTASSTPTVTAFGRAWTVAWADGAFRGQITVPSGAAIRDHVVAAGEAEAVLRVVPAPAQLVLRAPARVEPGEVFSVTAVHSTPAPRLVAGPLVWSDGTQTALTDGTATTHWSASAGRLTITVEHPGSERLQATNATATVLVIAPGDARQASQPAGGATDALPEVPWWAIAASVLVVLAVLAATRMRRPRRRVRGDLPAPVAAAPPLPSGSMASALAGFMAWLRHLGRADPGTTVREAAQRQPAILPMVEPFEAQRYGEARPGRDPAPHGMVAMLRRVVERLRGSP